MTGKREIKTSTPVKSKANSSQSEVNLKRHKSRKRQLSLFKPARSHTKLWWIQEQHVYGGSLNYRKVERPFDSKKLVHAVFKASLAKGLVFTRSRASIERLLNQCAHRYGVKVKDFAIEKNHLHVLFYTKHKEAATWFMRLFSAEMGRKYKKIYTRFGLKKTKPLWVARPFTRLVGWGKKSLKQVEQYIEKNKKEALGFIAYTPRNHKLSQFLGRWEQALALPSG